MNKEEVTKRFEAAKDTEERVKILEELEHLNDNELMVHFYNLWGEADYDKDVAVYKYRNPKVVAAAADDVMQSIKETGKILDIGAGTGMLGLEMKAKGYKHIDALDGSNGMLEAAKKHGVYKGLYQQILKPGGKISCCDQGTYDGVVSAGSFYETHLKACHLRQVVLMAKPGCFAVISGCYQKERQDEMEMTIKQMIDEGVMELVKKKHVDDWWAGQDGTLWVFKRIN